MKAIFKAGAILSIGLMLFACTAENQKDSESLYETEGTDITKIRRPGNGQG